MCSSDLPDLVIQTPSGHVLCVEAKWDSGEGSYPATETEKAIFQRELYDYATVLKYQVLEVHRGKVKGQTIYVGHYNPFKPRSEAADRRVQDVGGNLKSFRAGQVHRMALEGSMLDHFRGGILNKYSEEDTDPIYWAVWTNLVSG